MPAGRKRDFSLGFRQFCLFESSPFHVLAKQSHPSLAGGHVIFEVKQTEGRNKIREDKTLVLYSFLCLLLLSPVHMLLKPTKNSISSLIYFAFMNVFLKISSFFFLILLLPVLSLRQVSTAPPLVSFQLMLLESRRSFCSFFLAFWRGSRNDARKSKERVASGSRTT